MSKLLYRLFAWLAARFAPAPEPGQIYRPHERLIYPYHDGTREVTGDPLALHRRLMDVWPDLKVDLLVAFSESKDAGKAQIAVADKVRRVFNVPAPAAEGECRGTLSEPQLYGLLSHFMEFCEDVKKNSSRSSTSPTATSPPTPCSAADAPSTESSSGSGSTASVPTTDVPTPPPSVPASP